MDEEYVDLKLTKRACKDLMQILAESEGEKTRIKADLMFDNDHFIDCIGELLATIGIESTKAQREKLVGFINIDSVLKFHNDKENLERLTK